MNAEQRPLTILQVLPALVSGGVERGTLDISNALIKAGHRSVVASSGGPLVNPLRQAGARHITLPVHSKNPWIMWRNSYRLQSLITAEKIDLVHARSRAPAWSCLWAHRRKAFPFVTTFHGAHGTGNSLKRQYNAVLLRSDHTIAVSDYIAEHIKQHYPNTVSTMSVIPRGIDLEEFNPDSVTLERRNRLIKEWQIDPRVPVLFLPGRMTRLKGHQWFINALALLKDRPFQAIIAGDHHGRERYLEALHDQIRDTGLPLNQVKIVDRCDDMAAAYTVSDIVVSASTQPEAFGRTLCEAQVMGSLVIAPRHGGALETLAPMQQEHLVSLNDTQDFARIIRRCLTIDDVTRKKIQTHSREFVQQHFSLQNMTRQTLSLYEQTVLKLNASHFGNTPTSV